MRFLLMDRSFFIISIVFIILFSSSDARWFPELSSDRENSKSNPLTITDDDIHAQVAAPIEYQQADGIFFNFLCSLCIGMPSHSYNSHLFIPTFQLYRYIDSPFSYHNNSSEPYLTFIISIAMNYLHTRIDCFEVFRINKPIFFYFRRGRRVLCEDSERRRSKNM